MPKRGEGHVETQKSNRISEKYSKSKKMTERWFVVAAPATFVGRGS
jgi:hypothetical protein